MSIKSDSFGRVVLTKDDAMKFKRQAVYGRPSAAAVKSVERGVKLARKFKQDGKLSFKIRVPA